MTSLINKLKTLPERPGVYLFKDAAGEIIYVGKAKNLRNRVRSYFPHHPSLSRPPQAERGTKEEIMIPQIADLDYFLVSSEVESLILENNLIKQYRPRYNILLRDDKNYQFIKIDYEPQIPQIYTVRRIEKATKRRPLPLPPHPPATARRERAGHLGREFLSPGDGDPPAERAGRLGERSKKNKYFGPYTSGLAVRQTLKLIENIFHLCRNKKITGKPCFAYHLKRCPGVCVGEITLARYRHEMDEIASFLAHRQGAVITDLKQDMKKAAQSKNFEYAALLRDKLRALLSIWERQKIVSPKKENEDYLGLHVAAKEAVVNVFLVREGKLLNQEHFTLTHEDGNTEEILERFIVQYYQESSDVPKILLVPANLQNRDVIEAALSRLRKTKVAAVRPTRGRKAKLLALANENARAFYERERASFQKEDEMKILEELQKLLELPRRPVRIEGFDISNIQGTNPVGSLVVFTQGRPDKSQYRKFKINFKDTPDDFAMMREMLERRFQRITPHPTSPTRGEETPSNSLPSMGRVREGWPTPDLIIIDGGRGQLNVAIQVLQATRLRNGQASYPPDFAWTTCPTRLRLFEVRRESRRAGKLIPIIGLAKHSSPLPLSPGGRGIEGEEEKIYLPDKKTPIRLPADSPVLQLLQRIRDEAHRFAITFYRGRHRKEQIHSRLDEISGLGPKTKKLLLQKFGSVSAIRQASLEALAKAVGHARAKKIKELI